MAINYTYPVKTNPATTDEFLIIDSVDDTTKRVTAADILALGQGSDAGVSSFTTSTPLSNAGTNADVNLTLGTVPISKGGTGLDTIGTNGTVLTSDGTTASWSLASVSGFLPIVGGAMTGAITTNSTFDGRDVATDGMKLDTIATNADVTNTTSVTSAGALMDSELASVSDVKALNQSVVSGSTPVFGLSDMTYSTSNFIVVDSSNAQLFADGVDHSLLKARGTGFTSTYISSVAIGGTTFNQPAVFGEIYSDEGYFDIHYTGATNIAVTNLSATSTYVYIDKNNSLQQQTVVPTRQDWSRKMFVMRIGVDTSSSTILGFEYLNNPIGHYANSIRDLYTYLLAQGVPFKKGQIITGRSTDLGFDASAGTLMEFGGTGDINNANILSFNAVANTNYTLLSRTGIVSVETNLVKFWDNAGTITPLGSTTVVGHRLFRYSDGAFAMQYGQGNYANMDLAKSGVLLEDYVLNPLLEDATFFGWWLIESTATNTGGTTLTNFIEYTIGIQGGSSSDLSGFEAKGNKQDSLVVDGTGVKYTTVDAVNAGLATKLSLSGGVMTGEISGLMFLNQTVQVIAPVGGGTTFDASSGSFASLDVSASITSVTVTIVPNGTTAKLFLTNTGAGTSIGSWADSGGAAIEWAGGSPPTITTSGGVDVLTFEFLNGTVYGSIVQDYS
tara:strand:- start:2738 stop:4753 length:2016 start_codon:yes stop_codon:yes gene_type:complete